MKIAIHGNSVAAWCCAHLLTKAGFNPSLIRNSRPALPAIMLSDAALSLIRDIFERPELFRGAHRINRRVVTWGRNAQLLLLDHSAVVVSEHDLLQELERDLEPADEDVEADFEIFASRPLPSPEPAQHSFGSRIASVAKIRLPDARDSASCHVESLEDGWLFMIPDGADSGWLLSVRCPLQSEPLGSFPASPRITSPLFGPTWLACGTAAMAFDPICGDGTAHAVREAILASAVVRAIAGGGSATELLAHYEARLTIGFQRHLAACRDFYRSGNRGPWWDRELELLQQGWEWCSARMATHGKFRYQLIDFELKRLP